MRNLYSAEVTYQPQLPTTATICLIIFNLESAFKGVLLGLLAKFKEFVVRAFLHENCRKELKELNDLSSECTLKTEKACERNDFVLC